jgi:hypothetical protein
MLEADDSTALAEQEKAAQPTSLDLGDLSLDEADVLSDEDSTAAKKQDSSWDLEELESIFGEETEELLSVDETDGNMETPLDLESLDLDLDLEDSEKKSP